MNQRPHKILSLLMLFASVLSLSGLTSSCLRTRAQIAEDESTEPVAQQRISGRKTAAAAPQDDYVLDELKSELARVHSRLDDLEREQPKPEEAAALKKRVEALEKSDTEVRAALEQLKEDLQKSAAAKVEKAKSNPSDAFEKGKALFQAGNASDSVEQFTTYLDSGDTSHIEEATYLRAEANYNLKNYKQAILDYSKFPERFPKSKYHARALYRTGLSFESLGLKSDARVFFQDLVDKFPDSKEARTAKIRLDLDKPAKKKK